MRQPAAKRQIKAGAYLITSSIIVEMK